MFDMQSTVSATTALQETCLQGIGRESVESAWVYHRDGISLYGWFSERVVGVELWDVKN